MTRTKQNNKAKEEREAFQRMFWKYRDRKCPCCRAHFARIIRVAEGRGTPHDLADVLSLAMQTRDGWMTIRPRPTQDIEDVVRFLIQIGSMLTTLHAQGRDIRGPIRQAFSWMNVIAREKLLWELINGEWHPEWKTYAKFAST